MGSGGRRVTVIPARRGRARFLRTGRRACLRDVPPSPVDLSYLDGADFSEFIGSAAEEFAPGGGTAAARNASNDGGEAGLFPRRYDMRDYGFLTPVRNQSALGVCWAFSSCASMESNLLKKGRGEYDLSEWQLGYQSRQDVSPDKPSFSVNPDPLLPGDWSVGNRGLVGQQRDGDGFPCARHGAGV